MDYLIGGAYKALLFALYLKNSGSKITIITYNKDIIQYCKTEDIRYIPYEHSRPRIKYMYKLFKVKKNLDNLVKKINIKKEDRFFITGKTFAYDSFYLAKEFSKKSKVYYKIVDKDMKKYKFNPKKPIFLKGALLRTTVRLIFGITLIYYDVNKDPRVGIDESFFEENNIVEYKPKIPVEDMLLEAVKSSKSKYKEYDNLIMDDGGPLENIIKYDSTIKLYDFLMKLPIKFAFKKHPNTLGHEADSIKQFYELFKNCDEIPRYIPVELFCNNVRKNVMSIFSASLTTAAQIEHLNAISLLELVEWKNESYKKEFREYLIKKSNNKIIFPKTFEELSDILLS